MSVKVLTHVFEHSRASGNDRVVLLVLADHAHDDGTGAYPSHATIARKANIADRTVRDCLRRLEGMGEIWRQGIHPALRTVVFDLNLNLTLAEPAGVQNLPPPAESALPRQTAADKPSLEPSTKRGRQTVSTLDRSTPDERVSVDQGRAR